MKVRVNGDEREVPDDLDLASLIRLLGFRVEGVAAAVNGEVVTRGRQPEHRLREADRVEVIRAVGGG